MTENTQIKLFEDKKVRTLWDKESEEWYFSVVDVVAVLTESKDAPAYWRKLKQRLKEEGNETVTNCHALKMPAPDGKMRLTDCLNTEQLFRLIQSIPSPKAEPFKLWMAQVAKERLDEMQDPEQGIQRALAEYRALGYSENWINQRLKSIEIRKDLTDEWKKHGLKEGVQFATLTDIIYKTWAGKTAKEYKESLANGHRIYSIELDEINKASERFEGLSDAAANAANRATKTLHIDNLSLTQKTSDVNKKEK